MDRTPKMTDEGVSWQNHTCTQLKQIHGVHNLWYDISKNCWRYGNKELFPENIADTCNPVLCCPGCGRRLPVFATDGTYSRGEPMYMTILASKKPFKVSAVQGEALNQMGCTSFQVPGDTFDEMKQKAANRAQATLNAIKVQADHGEGEEGIWCIGKDADTVILAPFPQPEPTVTDP